MLGNTGVALMLAQDVVHLIQQSEEAKDAQLKRSIAETTTFFQAKIAENSTRAESERVQIIKRFEAMAAERAQSSAQVRLTMVLVPASAGLCPC